MSKIKSSRRAAVPKRRFSRGDGIRHAIGGLGHVMGTGRFVKDETGAGQWMCQVTFENDAAYVELGYRDIPESDLVSVPGTGERKYGQGAEGCRVGSSRYGNRRAQREISSNGRTVTHTLVRHHLGDDAR